MVFGCEDRPPLLRCFHVAAAGAAGAAGAAAAVGPGCDSPRSLALGSVAGAGAAVGAVVAAAGAVGQAAAARARTAVAAADGAAGCSDQGRVLAGPGCCPLLLLPLLLPPLLLPPLRPLAPLLARLSPWASLWCGGGCCCRCVSWTKWRWLVVGTMRDRASCGRRQLMGGWTAQGVH